MKTGYLCLGSEVDEMQYRKDVKESGQTLQRLKGRQC